MTNGRTTSRAAGFSLIEILMVIVVLVIVTAIVVPNLGTAADSQVASAVRVLQSDLDLARSMAVTTQKPYALVFSSDLTSYKVVANYWGDGSDYASLTAMDDPVAANKKRQVTLASLNHMGLVHVATVSFGGHNYVRYLSQGDPESGGSVTVRAGSIVWTVTVQNLTGLVTVARTTN
jgi:prepilin-type N-terminal cleavage/methylation domain-containing protein